MLAELVKLIFCSGYSIQPLDGLLGAQASASSGAPLPPQRIVVPPSAYNSYNNSGRQPVPCVFFQKGLCMKGDKCSFLHGTNPVVNKVQQATPTMLTGDLSSSKKPLGNFQKCSQQQKVPAETSKPQVPQSNAKLVLNAESNIPGNESLERGAPLARNIDEEACKPSHPSSILNGGSQIRSGRLHQTHALDERSFQNDKEAEEFLRESSPGFDVLVDDELGDSEYFNGEDQFGRMGARDRRNLSSVNEYDMDHPAEYNSLSDVDREMLRHRRPYESFNHMSGQFGWDQCQNQSEIMLGGVSRRDGRNLVRDESPDRFDGSDLRHRLSKHRRVNGLRSVVSNDFVPESHVKERNHRGFSQRDSQRPSSHEVSLSSRLKGRLKFPGRSAEDGSDDKPDREMDGGGSWGRVHQGKLGDRLKGRLQEENSSDTGRSSSRPWMRRETCYENDAHFLGPKSLAELKGMGQEVKSQESAARQQHSRSGDQQSDLDLSFEGPKPLSVLLKRKREAETAAASKGGPSVSVDANTEEVKGSGLIESCKIPLIITGAAGDMKQGTQGTNDSQSSLHDDANPSREKADGVIVEHEVDGDDQKDGFYDYEQADDGEYNYEVENADEEYLDDEDGDDDFAKKVGVMLT